MMVVSVATISTMMMMTITMTISTITTVTPATMMMTPTSLKITRLHQVINGLIFPYENIFILKITYQVAGNLVGSEIANKM